MEELANIIKSKRIELGISIAQVSDATKVRTSLLQAIEDGEFDKLPDVYGLSFLKEYLKYLKIDEDIYSAPLNEYRKTSNNKVSQTYKQINTANLGTLNNENKNLLSIYFNSNYVSYLMYLALGLTLIIVLYVALFYSPESDVEQEIINTASNIDTTVIEAENEDNLLSFFSKQDSIVLDVVAIDTAWIKIDIDGMRIEEALLVPNSKRVWKAKEYFNIHQGNVGALKIKRNGVLLEPFGSPGSVVKNVKVTKNSVEMNSPWKK